MRRCVTRWSVRCVDGCIVRGMSLQVRPAARRLPECARAPLGREGAPSYRALMSPHRVHARCHVDCDAGRRGMLCSCMLCHAMLWQAREVAKAQRQMPSVHHSALVARALARVSGWSDVFVQTASPAALANLSAALRGSGLRLSHSSNQRCARREPSPQSVAWLRSTALLCEPRFGALSCTEGDCPPLSRQV